MNRITTLDAEHARIASYIKVLERVAAEAQSLLDAGSFVAMQNAEARLKDALAALKETPKL